MKFDLDKIVRSNIKSLKPYSSARHEFTGEASVFLDANENSYGSPVFADGDSKFNRYPDPLQKKLKDKLSQIKKVAPENIFIGNGSDEAIDIAYRIFCEPGKSNAIICPPTYGMYEVSADINDIKIKKITLSEDFQLNVKEILNEMNDDSRLLFICSPNNPTGNSMNMRDIEVLLENFRGIVIIDEAYASYSIHPSFINEISRYPNLIVMQTLSKAWGMAGLRLGLSFASKEIIDLFNRVKPPYNINQSSQQLALKALENEQQVEHWIKNIIAERERLSKELKQFAFIEKIYPSDANFLLVKVKDADHLYQYLSGKGIIVRNRSREILLENCLRITIGTDEENRQLIKILNEYEI